MSTSPRQFGIRTLLGVMWFFSCMFAGFQWGLAPTVSFALPVALIGLGLISGHQWISDRANLRRTAIGAAACLILLAVTLFVVTPADAGAWMLLLGGVAWVVALNGVSPSRMKYLVYLPVCIQMLLLFSCAAPREAHAFLIVGGGNTIQDVRGSRMGIQFAGGRFITSSMNAELLEKYLGQIQPQWKHGSPLSPYVRDGNERVDIASVARRDYLPKVLAMLPNDDARRQVLRCLTDPANRLRVHQGLLLSCLYHKGYPPDHGAASWWQRHEWAFRPEHDPQRAVDLVFGWTDQIKAREPNSDVVGEVSRQVRAANYQEHGSWGGDHDFGEAYQTLEEQVMQAPNGVEAFPQLGIHRIVWWPAAQP